MFLKTLSIKGFKSFADAANIELEPGITVVVGPNGSGKSNVVDAIGWVLGAQAPSAVRSAKMDDVIFAGTADRPALGRAEVALTLDNSSGLLPIEFGEVTVSRTIFRSGDSEYAINGVSCRLLDIQELLSDTGVGRQQHVIISQGQIDAVLNSRPEERRLIIEEAAGVLKHRRRKEKAERRLAATEGNLNRIQDLLREVRRQMRPLERQADAASRHGSVLDEMVQLRIHLAGREYAEQQTRMESILTGRNDLVTRDRDLTRSLSTLDAGIVESEAELAAAGGDDLSDLLLRFERLGERTKGQIGVLTERRRGIDRDREAFVDRDVVASLENDASRLRKELGEVVEAGTTFGPARAELEEAEAAHAVEVEAFERDAAAATASEAQAGETDDAEREATAADVRRRIEGLRAGTDRSDAELRRGRGRQQQIETRREQFVGELQKLTELVDATGAAEDELLAAHASAEDRRAKAETELAAADAARRETADERSSWAARAEALELALDEARAAAGAERLAAVDGVVGTLLDLVEVDAGWEAAFEAAVGDALGAVVVDGVEHAREALELLRDDEVSGAVLAIGADGPAMVAPSIGEPVRSHVRAQRADVNRLLDSLLGSAVAVSGGWKAALDAALANPGSVVVTPEGDRFGLSGWRVGSSGSGATGAALEEARAKADVAAELAVAAAGRHDAARRETEDARRAEQQAARAIDDNTTRSQEAARNHERVLATRAELDTELGELSTHLTTMAERLDTEQSELTQLVELLPALEADEQEALARARARTDRRSELERDSRALTERRAAFDVEFAAVGERQSLIERRIAEVEERLERDAADRRAALTKVAELDRRERAIDGLLVHVRTRVDEIDGVLSGLREERRAQSEAVRSLSLKLDGLRKQRGLDERSLADTREKLQRSELEQAELKVRLETLAETLRRDMNCEPRRAMETPCPELPAGTPAPARLRELERELRLMGPINPLAVEEFKALQERHEFLTNQLDDVKATRRELGKVIAAIDQEIVSVFASAYADVAENFEHLFQTLFPGGKGSLKLTTPDDLLGTGLEIEARPSGKNVRRLTLLSGGERSLTALAFLFAVFRSRPSPFYVMDEVEAALDDMNLHRFLDLIAEFRNDAQLLIVSHQKRTMEAADCLYGVSMKPGGSSKVISERVENARFSEPLVDTRD